MHRLAHPDGEIATSRAAAKYGLCMGLSSYATESMENVAAEGTGNPYVMQLCVLRDRETTLQILRRAEGTSVSENPSFQLSRCIDTAYSFWVQGYLPVCRHPSTWTTTERIP